MIKKQIPTLLLFCVLGIGWGVAIGLFLGNTKTSYNSSLDTLFTSRNEPLDLTLGLDQPVYKVGETINPTVRITNERLRADILINSRLLLGVEIHFIIIGQDGQKVKWKYSNPDIGLPQTHDFVNLCASCEFRKTFYHLGYYYDLSIPGNYTIQVLYENHDDPKDGEVAWHGTLTSNIVLFSIFPSDE